MIKLYRENGNARIRIFGIPFIPCDNLKKNYLHNIIIVWFNLVASMNISNYDLLTKIRLTCSSFFALIAFWEIFWCVVHRCACWLTTCKLLHQSFLVLQCLQWLLEFDHHPVSSFSHVLCQDKISAMSICYVDFYFLYFFITHNIWLRRTANLSYSIAFPA